MIDYTDKVSEIFPDGTLAAFVVTGVKVIKVTDPEDENPVKKDRRKVEALRVSLKIVVHPEIAESEITDVIYLIRGKVEKLDRLREATGEEVKTRQFEEQELVGKTGFLSLSEREGRNYVHQYLSPSEGEEKYDAQLDLLNAPKP